jgi:hypothetical protein
MAAIIGKITLAPDSVIAVSPIVEYNNVICLFEGKI